MGWTGLRGNTSIREYAKTVWREGLEVVASNVHGSNEMYFALRQEDGKVFGAVIIIVGLLKLTGSNKTIVQAVTAPATGVKKGIKAVNG